MFRNSKGLVEIHELFHGLVVNLQTPEGLGFSYARKGRYNFRSSKLPCDVDRSRR